MSAFYKMEAVNLFADDHDPQNSKHLVLDELKLPDLQKIFQDHHPGGSPVAMEVAVGIAKLEPTFKLKGFDPRLLAQFGLGGQAKKVFTGYGVMRDVKTGALIQSVASIEGSLGKIAGDAMKRGELQGHEYALNEVTHYELTFGGQELWYWDFWTNTLRVDGVDQQGEVNRLMGLGG